MPQVLNTRNLYIPVKTIDPNVEDQFKIASGAGKAVRAYPTEWRDTFGEGYYEQQVKTKFDGEITDERRTFDTHPELDVTPPDDLNQNIELLMEELKTKHSQQTADDETDEEDIDDAGTELY